jgi:hypothetical protein
MFFSYKLSHVKKNQRAASAGDFIVVRFALIGSLGVAT